MKRGWPKGKKRSPEVTAKIVQTRKARHQVWMSTAAKKKISEYRQGRKLSQQHREAIREGVRKAGYRPSEEFKQRLRIRFTNRVFSPETRHKLSKNLIGKKYEEIYGEERGKEIAAAISRAHQKNWEGRPRSLKEPRNDPRYSIWRKAVLIRDQWTCLGCGMHNKVQAHHIKSWARFPALRYEVSNGITLCRIPCHREANRLQRIEERQAA